MRTMWNGNENFTSSIWWLKEIENEVINYITIGAGRLRALAYKGLTTHIDISNPEAMMFYSLSRSLFLNDPLIFSLLNFVLCLFLFAFSHIFSAFSWYVFLVLC